MRLGIAHEKALVTWQINKQGFKVPFQPAVERLKVAILQRIQQPDRHQFTRIQRRIRPFGLVAQSISYQTAQANDKVFRGHGSRILGSYLMTKKEGNRDLFQLTPVVNYQYVFRQTIPGTSIVHEETFMGEFLETRTVSYWSICFKWKVIPYPCRKKKEVEIWCYEFEWIRQAGKFLLWVTYEGCEDGLLYRWRELQFGGGGGVIGIPPFRKCFEGKKDDKGSCPAGDFDEVVE